MISESPRGKNHENFNCKHRRKIDLNLVSTTYGQGPDLVLLHGWGLNSGVWQALIPSLQSCFRLTTIDLPGFGLNHQQLPESFSLDNIATAVADVIPDDCAVLGWSLGGLVAQQLALNAQHKIRQLILVATSPCFMASHNWPGMQANVLENFNAQLEQNLALTISRFLAIQAIGSPSAKQDIKDIKHYLQQYPQAHPRALHGGLQLLQDCDLRAQTNAITCPVTYILGRLDSLVPVALQQHLPGLYPQLAIEIFDKSSHAPFISEPLLFTQVVTRILTT